MKLPHVPSTNRRASRNLRIREDIQVLSLASLGRNGDGAGEDLVGARGAIRVSMAVNADGLVKRFVIEDDRDKK
jgi:hypothetical protein